MIRGAILLLAAVALRLDAQVIEMPVPFDSVGRVTTLTPEAVVRYGLTPTVWPVTGDFVVARLYSASSGATVLAVERANGQIERHTLSDEQVSALRSTIDAALAVSVVAARERAPDVASGARGAFARNQMILSALVYGPLISSFADDGRSATALYLLSTGISFFVVNDLAKNTRVTRTQNDLATDGAIRGYAGASGLMYAFGGEEVNRKLYSAIGLAGAIGGSKAGFEYGRRLADNESQAARKVSTLSAVTALGVLGSAGLFEQTDQERPVVGAMVAAGLAGYAVGPTYPRRAPYTVTAGDIRLLSIGALIGLGVGATPVIGSDNSQVTWTGATVGMLGGIALMDRGWIRRYDHNHADATLTWLGTIAGSLMGGAVAVLTEPADPEPILGMLSVGALLGAVAGHGIARPELAVPRGDARTTGDARPAGVNAASVRFDLPSIALAVAGVPGQYQLFSVRF